MEKMTMENLIDVDGLSEEERAVILNVLKRDESLRKTESLKVRQLRLEIQSIRMKSVLRDGDDLSKMCARCHSELGFLFNRGEICPTCHFKVCKLCQETLLNGKWLCSLCYKQRQLKWLQQDGVQNSSGLKRWPSGADLVKASIRKTLVIADPGAESDPGAETGYKLNGATVRNGSIHKDKSPQDAERIEYPKDSDKRKLTQLFDAFKMQKKTDSPERRLQQQTSVRRATSRRYGTDTESSSSSDEDVSSSLPASMLTTVSVQSSPASSRVSGYNTTASEFEEIHVSDSVLHKTSESVNSSPRKSLQRKHSYDSDQTIHSDDAPFSKSSTETQIRVEVHSDASSTQSADIVRPKTSPSKSASSNSQNSYSKVRQSSKEGYVKVTRKESSSSQRSTSPEMGGMRHVQVSRQSVLQPGRSPSPYSFDSIPSSHANSPLPRQRILDQTLDYPLQKNSSEDTDSLSRFSGTEYSGTESSYHIRDGSSGGDDLMMDDISKVKFHKLSKKIEKSRSRSPHSPNTSSSPQLAEGGANCGRGGAVVGVDSDQLILPKAVTNISQSPSKVEGVIHTQQTFIQNSEKISDFEPIASVRRKAKIVNEPIDPPKKNESTKPKLISPSGKKHSDDINLIAPPPRKSKHVKEAELAVSLRKLQNPEDVEPIPPPRRSKAMEVFEPISPPGKSKNVHRYEQVCPPGSKIVQDPDPVPPPRRRSMRRSHEDISPPSSVPSSPVSYSGEDSSSERNLSIRDAKRLFEEKERLQRLGKSPRASPRGNHDSFFNDRIWQEETMEIASTPSSAPDDDFEALFSKAISDLEVPESPLPKIRSRSGSMRSRSGSKSKKRPLSGEFESDSESRKRTSTSELPIVKEPESDELKAAMLPVMIDLDEVIDSIGEQQVTSVPTVSIVVEDTTDPLQKCDAEVEPMVMDSRTEEPDIKPHVTINTLV
ncbi:uncharacterized protein LOC117327904 isoform X2 [Pecten maximus]|uniref:uncharacterized protein LOC117327904 isoform X2 n=1 Tax=Pecten maximus TaxID=6579 RepID=UPI0014590183|nr:uncharacterized protein LOC117327904 isoform X2 [Pecten maximus]